MANSYQNWQTFPLADQLGILGDEDLANAAIASAKPATVGDLADSQPPSSYGSSAATVGAIAPRTIDLGTLPAGPETAGPGFDNNLAMVRGRYAQEIVKNPDLRRKIMASMTAEVGDQSDLAHQAYLETAMNRAAARGKSLDATISNTKYYPSSTTSKLGATFSPEQQARLNPIINSVIGGSNVANFATGNESGGVHSGGAPVAFVPNPKAKYGERFVIENPDLKWANQLASISKQTPTPAPVASSASLAQTLTARQPMIAAVSLPPPPTAKGVLNLPDLAPLEPKRPDQQQLIAEARARIRFPKL